MWQRRAFLKAAGAGFVAGLMPRGVAALERSELIFASSVQKGAGGGYAAALVSERGALIASVDLPDRGHDIVFSPDGARAVAFARQPGNFAIVFDPQGRTAPVTLVSPADRHFFGHGAFSPDGRLLFATENDFESAQGVIGIYEVQAGYRRVSEFPTYGTGPHEMLLLPDGLTFVVANGGIETHPDYGRTELNLETMDPSVAFIDARDGSLIGQLRLDAGLHQLSIRHMAVDAGGRVWFGCQYRGAPEDRPQLVGYATRDGEIRLIELPDGTLDGLRNYIGSVAVSANGLHVAISSPEGGLVLVLDAGRGTVSGTLDLANGCGIAPAGAGFAASSGTGVLVGLDGADLPGGQAGFNFDNHLRLVRSAAG